MRNAEEHKKLLEQVAELGRNSTNYFDAGREFFLIDSYNLPSVQPRLYGYSIQASGIYEDDNLTAEAVAGLDGRGCYVYVDVADGQITIKQDLNGCWGIYLFRHGDYFALSNSFFRLLEHVKFRYPLTVNRDYCHYLLINDVSSHAYLATAVNEIQLTERNAVLHIDIAEKNLQIDLLDYKEHSLSPDSEEGIATLDRWFDFWSGVFRGVAQHAKFVTADLSGGYDSRVSFVPLLHSGADLNNLRIYSSNDGLHTHSEDYEIASKIAAHYNFALNRKHPERRFLNYSLADSFNFSLYTAQNVSLLPKLYTQKSVDKLYRINGAGGETIRHYWQSSPKNFMERQYSRTNRYFRDLSRKLSDSIENILKSGFEAVQVKYKIDDQESEDIPQYFYQETRCRHHFGKETLCYYLIGNICFSPAIDPDLRILKLSAPECPDADLLMALIFARYEPDLLKFPFQGGRSIAPETIAFAQKINERFPRAQKTDNREEGGGNFNLQPRDTQAEKILALGRNNPKVPERLVDTCLKAVFDSGRTYGLFSAYFDDEIYHNAAAYYADNVFGRARPIYAVVGVTKVLEDVETSRCSQPTSQYMNRFLEQDFCEIHNDAQTLRKFKSFFTARIDLQLTPKAGEDNLQILSVFDNRAQLEKPGWFQANGTGYIIHSYAGKLGIVAKAVADGKLKLELKGMDMRRPKERAKRVPYWVDYTALTVNGKKIFDKLTPAWHDKSYRCETDVKADEEITIQIEWLPHRSET